MSDPRGALTVKLNEKDYTLWLGMSVLAKLQGKYGQDVMQRLQPPEDAPEDWVPDLNIVVDLIQLSLGRYHKDEADEYFVDEIYNAHPNLLGDLMNSAFPDQTDNAGKTKGAKAAG